MDSLLVIFGAMAAVVDWGRLIEKFGMTNGPLISSVLYNLRLSVWGFATS